MLLRQSFALIVLALAGHSTMGQSTAEEAAVMKPIHLLFEGMRKADSALVSKAFVRGASFVIVDPGAEGNPQLVKSELGKFLISMARPRKEVYSEPIWDVNINIDGSLAKVWARYAFYIDRQLHHCGIDTFQLLKVKNEWRIFHLAYTRQDKDCVVPQQIQDQYK